MCAFYFSLRIKCLKEIGTTKSFNTKILKLFWEGNLNNTDVHFSSKKRPSTRLTLKVAY